MPAADPRPVHALSLRGLLRGAFTPTAMMADPLLAQSLPTVWSQRRSSP